MSLIYLYWMTLPNEQMVGKKKKREKSIHLGDIFRGLSKVPATSSAPAEH